MGFTENSSGVLWVIEYHHKDRWFPVWHEITAAEETARHRFAQFYSDRSEYRLMRYVREAG